MLPLLLFVISSLHVLGSSCQRNRWDGIAQNWRGCSWAFVDLPLKECALCIKSGAQKGQITLEPTSPLSICYIKNKTKQNKLPGQELKMRECLFSKLLLNLHPHIKTPLLKCLFLKLIWEREIETWIRLPCCLLHVPNLTSTGACALTWNWTGDDLLVHGTTLKQLSHTGQAERP